MSHPIPSQTSSSVSMRQRNHSSDTWENNASSASSSHAYDGSNIPSERIRRGSSSAVASSMSPTHSERSTSFYSSESSDDDSWISMDRSKQKQFLSYQSTSNYLAEDPSFYPGSSPTQLRLIQNLFPKLSIRSSGRSPFTSHLLFCLVTFFLLFPTLEIILFIFLSDVVREYFDLHFESDTQPLSIIFTAIDFFSNTLGALSALGLWLCTYFIISGDVYKARNESHLVPSSEWWINAAVYFLLGFLACTFLTYQISDALIHTVQEWRNWVKLFHFASLFIQRVAEISIVVRSLQISISRWWTKIPSLVMSRDNSRRAARNRAKKAAQQPIRDPLVEEAFEYQHLFSLDSSKLTASSSEKRLLIVCIMYCSYVYFILLLKSILQANLNPIQFKTLLDIMHYSASNLTLSLVRPGYQMLYFKLMICFLFVFLRWFIRTICCNYSWGAFPDEEDQTLLQPRKHMTVRRTISKTHLLGIIICSSIIALHWVQISENSAVSVGAARICEAVVYVIMFLWSLLFLWKRFCSWKRCCSNECMNGGEMIPPMTTQTFSLLLVTFLTLVAQSASSLIHVFSPDQDWLAFAAAFAPLPFILVQSVVILLCKPQGIYRIVLLAVNVAFCYYSLANEGHHIEDLLNHDIHGTSDWPLIFIISIFWSVLEYYSLVVENILLSWLEELYTVVYD